jgi:hypothetical protein
MIAVLDDQFEVWWTFFHYMICSVLMLVTLGLATCFSGALKGLGLSLLKFLDQLSGFI